MSVEQGNHAGVHRRKREEPGCVESVSDCPRNQRTKHWPSELGSRCASRHHKCLASAKDEAAPTRTRIEKMRKRFVGTDLDLI
ncbi:hypothetical protein BaRGS_00027709 [Batillaria attramentaria]|uniref:Uncharacterized protein n=1 Tax=Batillaria attramentaria TaxID=370345 RepID=A0ABD0K295_9CAEN